MTKREKVIVMAYTGVCMLQGRDFQLYHNYIEEKLNRPVFTHELADPALMEQIKSASEADFIALCKTCKQDGGLELPGYVVPVNDSFGEMMNWAVRYALGRCSYAVGDTVRYITNVVEKLNYRTLYVIAQDIKEAYRHGYMGDPMVDQPSWMQLLERVNKEIEKRKEEEGK